jgi:hypothetical protein
VKYRNISDRTLEVAPSTGAPLVAVAPDGLVEADPKDDRVWPDTLWQPVTTKKKETD